MTPPPFSGSYPAGAVEFLLTPIAVPHTPLAAKERLIQSGQRHYSQLLSHERLPPPDYLELFHQALADNKRRLAADILALARRIVQSRRDGITLVSLARAGTPVGVLLKQALQRFFNQEAAHYSVSIIRDLGLDANALRHILKRHPPSSLVFVDGWTGKGVIAGQLAASLAAFAQTDGVAIAPELHVLADLAGVAAVAATTDDYLIPSCILNATVSGLVSRSVHDPRLLAAGDFHGCVFYQEFAAHDLSNFFIAQVLDSAAAQWPQAQAAPAMVDRARLQAQTGGYLAELGRRHQTASGHLLKPGLGEATRALLRRGVRLLLLRGADDPASAHLRWLAASRQVPVAIEPQMPYKAVALIQALT